MRIIGLDFGAMTCGVAVSDELLITAQPLETIRRKHENKLRQTFAHIEEICQEYGAQRIVVGLPKRLDGSEGERAAACRAFAEDVKRRTGLETLMWDERLTTVEAHRQRRHDQDLRSGRKGRGRDDARGLRKSVLEALQGL